MKIKIEINKMTLLKKTFMLVLMAAHLQKFGE